MIVDAWSQHPTPRHLSHPMFDSLRRWTRGEAGSRLSPATDEAWPVAVTLAAMDEGGIDKSLITAWEGPRGSLISNDEVAGFVREDDPMWGVFRFKEGLGGQAVRGLGAWDLPVKRLSYQLYTQVLPRLLEQMRRRGKERTRQLAT